MLWTINIAIKSLDQKLRQLNVVATVQLEPPSVRHQVGFIIVASLVSQMRTTFDIISIRQGMTFVFWMVKECGPLARRMF